MSLLEVGLAIILIILILAIALYVLTVARDTYNIEDILSQPWDGTNDTSVKTVESGAKPVKRKAPTKKKPASSRVSKETVK